MDNFKMLMLKKIERLLTLEVGDTLRLKHIKNCILENKKLYNSDIKYVSELEKMNPYSSTSNLEEIPLDNFNSCKKCGKILENDAKFCSYCGTKKNYEVSDFDEVLTRRKHFKALKTILGLHSYQILSLVGGFAGLIPIVFAISSIGRIIEIIEYYTGRDLTEFSYDFISLGVVSSILCVLVISLPLIIKKPKKIGKFLFFSSFGIVISSLMIGVVGFAVILFASILAMKKRRY